MGTDYFVVLNDNATAALSIRTIFGAFIAIILLLLATTLFRKYKNIQEILFVLLVGIVLLATTVLVTTALFARGTI